MTFPRMSSLFQPSSFASFLVQLLVFASAIRAAPHRITIPVSVPEGTSQHNDPSLVCPPSRWYTIVIFFAVNYLAHAATVPAIPGGSILANVLSFSFALMFPFSGVLLGLGNISRRSSLCRDNLVKAVRSGVLCIVVRDTNWEPRVDMSLQGIRVTEDTEPSRSAHVAPEAEHEAQGIEPLDRDAVRPTPNHDRGIHLATLRNASHRRLNLSAPDAEPEQIPSDFENASWAEMRVARQRTLNQNHPLFRRRVLGLQYLPEGYTLSVLPRNAVVHSLDDGPERGAQDVYLNPSINVPKSLIAIVQSIFSGITLYRTRGDEIDQYGYASYGFTVIPYLIMSIINLFGSVLTPEYPSMYLVKSPEMEEAELAEHGGVFSAVVGQVAQKEWQGQQREWYRIDHGQGVIVSMSEPSTADNGPPDGQDVSSGSDVEDKDDGSQRQLEAVAQRPQRCFRFSTYTGHPTKLTIPANTPFKTEQGGVFPGKWRQFAAPLSALFIIALAALPYAVIGGLSHFRHGRQSTKAQRVLTQFWLAAGIYFMGIAYMDEFNASFFLGIAIWAAPTLGGFVVVGQMLADYGSCTRF